MFLKCGNCCSGIRFANVHRCVLQCCCIETRIYSCFFLFVCAVYYSAEITGLLMVLSAIKLEYHISHSCVLSIAILIKQLFNIIRHVEIMII